MRLLVTFAATAALGLGACGEEAAREAGSDVPTQATAPAEAKEKTKPACERASRKLLDAIATGLEVSGGGGRLTRGYVVKSGEFARVYMVAAEIDGPGLQDDGDVGVWATNSKTPDGMIFAIDGAAQEFSDWGDGDKTDAAIDQSADGVSRAKDCAQG